jgi:hypothetical protein
VREAFDVAGKVLIEGRQGRDRDPGTETSAGEDEEEVDSRVSARDEGQDCFDTGRCVLLRLHREHRQRCQRPDAGQRR